MNDGDNQQAPKRETRNGLSNRWLVAAVVASLIGAALILIVFIGLQRLPFLGETGDAISGVGASSDALVFAIARTPGGPDEWSNWARVVKYVSETVHRPVTIRYLTKEDEASTVIEQEHVDVAFVCSHHYLHLSEKGVVEGLCVPVIDGSPTCTYMVLVAEDDPATCLEDLRGSAIAASDKSSLGGYSYLRYICDEHKLNDAEFFGEVRLGDTQEHNLRDLSAGEVRAAAVNSAQAVSWDLTGYKAIEQSPPVGCPPVVVSSELDPAIRDAVAAAFLAFEPGVGVAEDSHIDGFIPFDATLYDYAQEIRDACGHHTK